MSIASDHGSVIGYACVRTTGPGLETQAALLSAAGCTRIYRDNATSTGGDRTGLSMMLKNLAVDDLVMVTSVDRFAHSILDLCTIINTITAAGAGFRSLDEPWADTRARTARTMLSVVEGLANLERSIMTARLADGRTRAHLRGERTGRPPRFKAEQIAELRSRRAEGASLSQLARSYGVSLTTIRRICV